MFDTIFTYWAMRRASFLLLIIPWTRTLIPQYGIRWHHYTRIVVRFLWNLCYTSKIKIHCQIMKNNTVWWHLQQMWNKRMQQAWCLCLTYTHYVHEAVHAVAYLEEKVLPLPFGWGAEGGPHQPGNTRNEEQRAEDNGCNLHFLNHSQRDGLPLDGDTKTEWKSNSGKSCKLLLDYAR